MTGIRSIATGLAVAFCLLAAGCGGPSRPSGAPVTLGGEVQPSETGGSGETPEAPKPRKVDPRRGGFEIGFGEYAVTLEAPAIRPGPVTFEVHNGGKLVHGFEMQIEGGDGDSSGPGSGSDDGFKIERPSFGPGETIRIPLSLAPGVYTRSSAGSTATTTWGWRSSSTCGPTHNWCVSCPPAAAVTRCP